MEIKHTPGPWQIDETKFGRRTIKNAKGASVVVIEKWTAEEDACLIAAAPELLAALKELRDAYLSVHDGNETHISARALAAIVKAERRDLLATLDGGK